MVPGSSAGCQIHSGTEPHPGGICHDPDPLRTTEYLPAKGETVLNRGLELEGGGQRLPRAEELELALPTVLLFSLSLLCQI